MHRTGVARQTVRRHFFILSFSLQGRMRLMNACVWGGGGQKKTEISPTRIGLLTNGRQTLCDHSLT